MAKVFYDHLVQIDELLLEFDNYEIAVEEKKELIMLVDETVHHRVLDIILTYLPKPKHEHFLTLFHQAPYRPELLDFLKEEKADIEKIIQEEANKIKKEVLAEIKKAKKG